MMSETISYTPRLREIRVDPLISEESVIQNNQPQEQMTDETIGNNSSQNNGRSSWLSFIMEEAVEVKTNLLLQTKIPKAADELKIHGNEEYYNPLVVSIGPYHFLHRHNKLSEVETLKVRMTRQFILDGGKDIEVLYSEVEKLTQNAREYYEESSIEGFNDEQFAQMMFLDGCFILQFINCIMSNDENLEMSDQQVADVKRDLLLLENQLPFPVLQSLMSLRYEKDYGMKLMCDFLIYQILQPKDQPSLGRRLVLLGMQRSLALLLLVLTIAFLPIASQPEQAAASDSAPESTAVLPVPLPMKIMVIILYLIILIFFFVFLHVLVRLLVRLLRKKRQAYGKPDQQPAHLLELLYFIFVCSQKGKGQPSPGRCCRYLSYLVTCLKKFIPAKMKSKSAVARGSRGRCLYYSAKDLKKVGIHFMPSRTSTLTDVKFKSSFFYGTVKLPAITIDVSTKSMLFNLVAYETSAPLWVTSYICFMDSLIQNADDVEELRSKGILNNFLGTDQQVAELFNRMGSSLKPDTSAHNDVKRDINKQCDSVMKKWVAEWQQTYFSSPWTFITLVAAAAGLVLTYIQTYYTANPPTK